MATVAKDGPASHYVIYVREFPEDMNLARRRKENAHE
jgi:hypothetical protein